jgi:hypothetical protein
MLPQGSFEKCADAALIFDNQYFRGDGPRLGTQDRESYREPEPGSSLCHFPWHRRLPLLGEWTLTVTVRGHPLMGR